MRFRAELLVGALLGVVCESPVTAQALADSADKFAFDLDTQSGHYSTWTLMTLRHECLRAKLVIGELRWDTRWLPAFGMWLNNGDDRVFLRIAAPERKTRLALALLGTHSRQKVDSAAFRRTLDRGDTVHVSMDWSLPGVLRTAIDSEVQKIDLPFRPLSFEVTGSSGQLKADSLELTACH